MNYLLFGGDGLMMVGYHCGHRAQIGCLILVGQGCALGWWCCVLQQPLYFCALRSRVLVSHIHKCVLVKLKNVCYLVEPHHYVVLCIGLLCVGLNMWRVGVAMYLLYSQGILVCNLDLGVWQIKTCFWGAFPCIGHIGNVEFVFFVCRKCKGLSINDFKKKWLIWS